MCGGQHSQPEAVKSRPSRVQKTLHGRIRSWREVVRLLPLAGPLPAVCALLVNLALGVLPLVFVVGTSLMLERIAGLGKAQPAAHSWSSVLAAFGLAIGALVAQNALSPLQTAFGELITRRIDGHCIRRLMSACLREAPIVLLEQQDVLDQLNLARQCLTERGRTPGSATAGLIALIARYTQFLGAAVLVSIVLGPIAGATLAVTVAMIRLGSRSSLTRWSYLIRDDLRGLRRKMRYVLDTGGDVAAAKEVRVLGILPWLKQRADADTRAYFGPLWRERRRIYFAPFLFLAAIMFAGTVAVLLWLRAGEATGRISVLGLSLVIQAIVVLPRTGTFFPESDLQTMWGMLASEVMERLDTQFRDGTEAKAKSYMDAQSAEAPTLWSTGMAARTRKGIKQAAPTEQLVPLKGLPRAVIQFEDVHFTYPGGCRPVLSGLNLELRAGTSTAIVGLNGCGKTTLVKLLARLYKPDQGRVVVDGTDLRDLDAHDWQRCLAVIFQDYVRYELEAAANIGLGAPDHLSDRPGLLAATERAGAAEIFAALPGGLATPLSSRYADGVDLSGGQWQRIALARALFAVGAGASVLVLDEPTAQLDVRAEGAFFDSFLGLTAGLTTIVISHRFSTVRRADRIVVLEGGRICESGTHAQLLHRGGRYAELFRLQARRFTVADQEDAIHQRWRAEAGDGPEARTELDEFL